MRGLTMVFATIMMCAGPVVGHAQDATRTESLTVKAGQPQRVAFYPAAKADCTRTPLPVVRLLDEPRHGKLIVRRATVTAGPKSACPGQSIPGQLVLYIANPNYTGDDQLTYAIQVVERKATIRLNLRVTAGRRPAQDMIDL